VIHDGVSPWEIDFRPVMKAAVEDLIGGRSAATISARFHNTVAAATIEVTRAALNVTGDVPVVLSGGCFQNVRLAEEIISALRPRHRIYMNHEVPPGDGGLALGQAVVANAIAKRDSSRSELTTEVAACA
jgi:hydrogenase maturation protein HypF